MKHAFMRVMVALGGGLVDTHVNLNKAMCTRRECRHKAGYMDAENDTRCTDRRYNMAVKCMNKSRKLRNQDKRAAIDILRLLTTELEGYERPRVFIARDSKVEMEQSPESPQKLVFMRVGRRSTLRVYSRDSWVDQFHFSLPSVRGRVRCTQILRV